MIQGREKRWRSVPSISDDRELAAVNAGHEAMLDLVTDNFDAACAVSLAAVAAFVEVDAEWSAAARGTKEEPDA